MITTSVAEAAEYLTQGKVLAYPTEAVWGWSQNQINGTRFPWNLRLKQRPLKKVWFCLLATSIKLSICYKIYNLLFVNKLLKHGQIVHCNDRATMVTLTTDEHILTWIKGDHPKVCCPCHNTSTCVALCNAFNGFITRLASILLGLNLHAHYKMQINYFNFEINYLNGDLGLGTEPSKILDAESGNIIRA